MRRKPVEKMSKRPQAIRARLRNNDKTRNEDLAMLVEADGRKPIHEWTLEELARGKARKPDGNWPSISPKWITPMVQEEIRKRFREQAFEELSVHIGPAIKVLTDLLSNTTKDDEGKPFVTAREKIDIAKFIVEHVLGKPKAQIELAAGPKYKEFLANAIMLDDGQPDYGAGVIEGEVVEDDE